MPLAFTVSCETTVAPVAAEPPALQPPPKPKFCRFELENLQLRREDLVVTSLKRALRWWSLLEALKPASPPYGLAEDKGRGDERLGVYNKGKALSLDRTGGKSG